MPSGTRVLLLAAALSLTGPRAFADTGDTGDSGDSDTGSAEDTDLPPEDTDAPDTDATDTDATDTGADTEVDDTEDTTEEDTPTVTRTPTATGLAGELGGFGCSSTRFTFGLSPMLLIPALLRRRKVT